MSEILVYEIGELGYAPNIEFAMDAQSSSTRIPLPLATAGIGLLLSLGLDGKIGTMMPIVIGFVVGCGMLYIEGVLESRAAKYGKVEASVATISCPNCEKKLEIHLRLPGSRSGAESSSKSSS